MSNKITASRLRQIIQEELVKALVEGDPAAPSAAAPSLGNTKDTAQSKKVGGMLDRSKALQDAIGSVKGKEGAASVVADVIDMLTKDGGVDKAQLASKLMSIASDLKKQ